METEIKNNRTDKLLRVALLVSAGVLFATSIAAGVFATVGFGERKKKPKRDPNYHDFTETSEALSDITVH